MTPVSPWLTLKAFEDERLMMEILRGSPALSAFRINKLLARFQAANLPVSAIYAEYIHFADLNAPLSADDRERLARLLQYGPSLSSHTPTGKLLLVTPRPGTISPWSSKATDIAPQLRSDSGRAPGARRGVLR